MALEFDHEEVDKTKALSFLLEEAVEERALSVLEHLVLVDQAEWLREDAWRHALEWCGVHGFSEGAGIILRGRAGRWGESERQRTVDRAAYFAAHG